MKYVQINSVSFGSTGGVMRQVHNEQIALGNDSYMLWGRGREAENSREFKYGAPQDFYLDVAQTFIDGKTGFHLKKATQRLLTKLEEIDPDVVHLHNLHGYHVNIEMLFQWLAEHRCHVNWTLHDCWAFTGHCSYFTYAHCEQWRFCCGRYETCPQLTEYPPTFSGSSVAWNFDQKKRLFTLLPSERLTFITPSQWLADLVKVSFLSKYPIEVRHNTIDVGVFKPTQSDFRKKKGIEGKFMILGVASPWVDRKGLDDFQKLADDLDERFVIVLVGLSKKQIAAMPKNVIGLTRTESKEQLAEIYSTADVFFNPTREDNYPTTNLEAEACGTRVYTYDIGGCNETIRMAESKLVDYDSFVAAIKQDADRMS